jgi:hypothetical protein
MWDSGEQIKNMLRWKDATGPHMAGRQLDRVRFSERSPQRVRVTETADLAGQFQAVEKALNVTEK